MAHQTGTLRWKPFARYGIQYAYGTSIYYDGNTIGNLNYVIKKANSSDTYYTAYLLVGSSELVTYSTKVLWSAEHHF